MMGSQPDEGIPAHETPVHAVHLPTYRIGRYPVTNRQYAVFLKQQWRQEVPDKWMWMLREPPADKLDHPVVTVSWHDARTYCDWLSQQTGRQYRLPTEAEWEKAARGAEGWCYPWGNEWEDGRCHYRSDHTQPVTAFPAGASVYGCCEMLGNVQEWTSTLWGSDPQATSFPYPYHPNDGREDLEAEQRLPVVYRVHRGGSYRDDRSMLRCSARGYAAPTSEIGWRGFRVAFDLEGEEGHAEDRQKPDTR